VDALKCNPTTKVECADGNYKAKSKYGTAIGSDVKASCCAPVDLCKDVTCKAGMKKMSTVTDATKCKAAASDCESTCCEDDATCKDVTCKAGTKKKSSVTDATKCTGAAMKCYDTCCEKDVTKCGGLTGISCATGTYKDQQPDATWMNTAATNAS